MPKQLAALVFTAGIIWLIRSDRDSEPQPSNAIWLPVLWLFVGASRAVSQWLSWNGQVGSTAEQYADGSPLDAAILAVLLAAGLAVLVMRARKSGTFLRDNAPILIFLGYCVLSALWSDFPFVAFKRWTKALGNVTMIFIVLTDPDPAAAARRFLSRTGFILIPLSVLLVKYYPELGRGYDPFTGNAMYLGAVGDKNGLGYDCLIFGLGSVWCLIADFKLEIDRRRQLIAHGIILGMVLWLFHLANSATSQTSFMLGSALMLSMTFFAKGKPGRVHLIVGSLIFVVAFAAMFPDSYAFAVHAVGRETNLTGRTDLWADLLRIEPNPIVGTGFESFFLGDRLAFLWSKYRWHPQEAHNGYLEIYLTLGWVGISLLAMVILSGYKNIIKGYRSDKHLGALRLAFLFTALVYNSTEAAFKIMHPVLIMFLMAVVAVPKAASTVEATQPIPDPIRRVGLRTVQNA